MKTRAEKFLNDFMQKFDENGLSAPEDILYKRAYSVLDELNGSASEIIKKCENCESSNIIKDALYRCVDCNCFHDKNGNQL